MERNNYFVGSLTTDQRNYAFYRLEDLQETSLLTQDGEFEKSEKQFQMIHLVERFIQEDLEQLGIPSSTKFIPESVHILPSEVYEQRFPTMTTADGFVDDLSGSIYINHDSYNGSMLTEIKVMLFCALRKFGYQSYFWESETDTLSPYRMGYWMNNPLRESHEHFAGFNNAVMERISREILYIKHPNEVKEMFSEPGKDPLIITSFNDYVEVLDEIIEYWVGEKEFATEEVWKIIKHGYYTGDPTTLREMETIFGKGTLRVIGALGSSESKLSREKAVKKCLQYLSQVDQQKQIVLARTILSISEFDLYSRLQ